MSESLENFCVSPEATVRQAVALIDRNQRGIVLAVDADRRLIGTITDGDVRRGMLAGETLDTPVSDLLARKANSPYAQPVSARVGTDAVALLQMMHALSIRQIPLVDEDERVAGVVTIDELLPEEVPRIRAVIMAGGFGTRLLPLTEDMPKPMLRVGERPLMELIIGQLRQAGIRHVNVTTHYLPDKIREHFGNGETFGVDLTYVNEETPLGTAGALGSMHASTEPILVINGDILTQVDFRSMLHYHREHHADMTVGVRRYEFEVPYGVVECDLSRIVAVKEKPSLNFFINAGIYLLEPSAYECIPNGEKFQMTDLIQRLIDGNRTVVSFPIREYWLDIGKHDDYQRAQADLKDGRFR